MPTAFTPVTALVGGAMIGLAAVLLLALVGLARGTLEALVFVAALLAGSQLARLLPDKS